MDELSDIYDSIVARRVADAVLQRTMNFSRRRSLQSLHSLRWRLLTGLLSANVHVNNYSEEWARSTRQCAEEWGKRLEQLKGRARDTPDARALVKRRACFSESDSSSEETTDPDVENPLMPAAGSSYAWKYHLNKLNSVIALDVDRIHWDLPLFELPATRESLLNMLSSYCIQHTCEYKQGMHEIAAFVLYFTHKDADIIEHLCSERGWGSASLPTVFASVCPSDGVVAVAYYIFEAIMTKRGVNLSALYFGAGDGHPDGIVAASRNVQGKLLLELDAQLHHRMNTLYKISPTLYLIRWLRLLFLREFPLEQCADLWDVFLSERFITPVTDYHIETSCISLLAAVMLVNIGDDIIRGPNEAIERVMRYPPVANVSTLVSEAVLHLGRVNCCLSRYHIAADAAQAEEEEEEEYSHVEVDLNVSDESTTSEAHLSLMKRQAIALSSVVEKLERESTPCKNSAGETVRVISVGVYEAIVMEMENIRHELLRYSTVKKVE